jgi:hypothetical protein
LRAALRNRARCGAKIKRSCGDGSIHGIPISLCVCRLIRQRGCDRQY